MPTRRQDIEGWLRRAEINGATHVIVVCDTFDHEDYPVFVKPGTTIETEISRVNNASMQRIMEIYNMSLPWEEQLAERRAYHL